MQPDLPSTGVQGFYLEIYLGQHLGIALEILETNQELPKEYVETMLGVAWLISRIAALARQLAQATEPGKWTVSFLRSITGVNEKYEVHVRSTFIDTSNRAIPYFWGVSRSDNGGAPPCLSGEERGPGAEPRRLRQPPLDNFNAA
jgi:hypothetical protein